MASSATEDGKASSANELAVVEEQHDWLTLIPTILDRRNLKCTEQTAESARDLMNAGYLGNFTQADENSFLSTQVEESSQHLVAKVKQRFAGSFSRDRFQVPNCPRNVTC